MELDITMRYVMVQALRKAAGGALYVEHVFMAMLELCDKKTSDICRRPDHEKEVKGGLATVASFITESGIDLWPTLGLLEATLAGTLQGDFPTPDTDVPGWLDRHQDGSDASPQSTPGHFLTGFAEGRPPLLAWCWVECAGRPTSRKNAAVKVREILTERLGYMSAGQIAAETVSQPGKNIIVTQPQSPPAKTLPVAGAPELPTLQVRPADQTEPEPSNAATMACINRTASVAALKADGATSKKSLLSGRQTRISGLRFKGGPLKATIKYYILLLFIPALLGVLFHDKLQQWAAAHLWRQTALQIALVVLAAMNLRGLFGLLGQLCKALEVFGNIVVNIVWAPLVVLILFQAFGYATPPTYIKITAMVYTFFSIAMGLAVLRYLPKNMFPDRQMYALRTSLGRICGLPSTIFFEYAFRALILPLLVFAVIWVGNLHLNGVWWAVLAVYGFLWVYEILRTLLHAWNLVYTDNKASRCFKLNQFLLAQLYFFGLPALGVFVMWYFGWLPMRTWVIVLYGIYGLLWLWVTLGLLTVFNRKGAQL